MNQYFQEKTNEDLQKKIKLIEEELKILKNEDLCIKLISKFNECNYKLDVKMANLQYIFKINQREYIIEIKNNSYYFDEGIYNDPAEIINTIKIIEKYSNYENNDIINIIPKLSKHIKLNINNSLCFTTDKFTLLIFKKENKYCCFDINKHLCSTFDNLTDTARFINKEYFEYKDCHNF